MFLILIATRGISNIVDNLYNFGDLHTVEVGAYGCNKFNSIKNVEAQMNQHFP